LDGVGVFERGGIRDAAVPEKFDGRGVFA